MVEAQTTFLCSFCGLRKNIRFLNSSLTEKANLVAIKQDIENKEKYLEELQEKLMKSSDAFINSALNAQISATEKALMELTKKAERSKREICSLCIDQGAKKVEIQTFTCEFCKETKKGGGLKRHIEGWESRGIRPWMITIVCRQCQNDYAFSSPPDFYCPLTSSGRDYTGTGEEPRRFDCSCEVPESILDGNW